MQYNSIRTRKNSFPYYTTHSWNADMPAHAQKRYRHIYNYIYIYIDLYILSGAYEPPKAARSIQLRIIAQNGVCIYSST